MRKAADSSEIQAITPETREPAAEWVTLDRIHVWAKNPKPYEPKHIRELSRSIKRFGFGDPIVARLENGEIIAGHLRYAAAKRLKLHRVPVRFLDLPEDEAHVMAVAETKLERMREFDRDQLAARMDELEAAGADLEFGTGFDADEVDDLVEGDGESFDAGDEGAEGGSGGTDALTYRLLVTCKDDGQQAELLARLEAEGFECKPMMN